MFSSVFRRGANRFQNVIDGVKHASQRVSGIAHEAKENLSHKLVGATPSEESLADRITAPYRNKVDGWTKSVLSKLHRPNLRGLEDPVYIPYSADYRKPVQNSVPPSHISHASHETRRLYQVIFHQERFRAQPCSRKTESGNLMEMRPVREERSTNLEMESRPLARHEEKVSDLYPQRWQDIADMKIMSKRY
eukprot:GDKJ01028041.1.p1 GENE.GDKJ01028041.1~~GDKJ01028041.1.p1  ORF type:complete len:192 (+),score=7.19 GDKJ01028041.1:164-739(+)